VFIERLWRSLKHEDVYLKGYADGREAHAALLRGSCFTMPRARTRLWTTACQWRCGAKV
jgi:hypothetical protein